MLNRHHCLILANGFYEWKRTAGTKKQPHFIELNDGAPMAFAGLWDVWLPPVTSCTIITTGGSGIVIISREFTFEGNTIEGHTMLAVLKRFQERVGETRPVIVADAAMLSKTNMQELEKEGYCYIVGARLANTAAGFINLIDRTLPRTDKAMRRFDRRSFGPERRLVA